MDADDDRGSLPAIFGVCLALSAFLMAPVPFLGPIIGIVGWVFSWYGRHSHFRGSARLGMWVNGLSAVLGIAITVWFLRRS